MAWVLPCLFTILVARARATSVIPLPNCDLSISEAFRLYMIVPQIIPEAPPTLVSDFYGDCRANLGNRIPPCATTKRPLTTWPSAIRSTLYTLMALDPDTTEMYTDEKGVQALYGLIVNIPGANVDEGQALSPYVPPAPLPGNGDHRYICLVYRQPARIPVTTQLLINVTASFRNFSSADFVSRYRLGNPIAGNFFRSRQNGCCEGCDDTCGKYGCCDRGCDYNYK